MRPSDCCKQLSTGAVAFHQSCWQHSPIRLHFNVCRATARLLLLRIDFCRHQQPQLAQPVRHHNAKLAGCIYVVAATCVRGGRFMMSLFMVCRDRVGPVPSQQSVPAQSAASWVIRVAEHSGMLACGRAAKPSPSKRTTSNRLVW